MPFFYVDWYYIVLVLPAVILSLWASAHVKSTFRRYSQVRNARGMTGAEAAMAVLRAHGVTDVRVEHVSGDLTDHFDPKDHVIRLSDSVYNVATPAAVGVAAHEAGHAVQYARHYAPIYIRAAIVPVTNIGSRLSMPLIVLG
ncbi:MAG: zinc metallopeptidase, partial [Oscillospiraceae bacterium]